MAKHVKPGSRVRKGITATSILALAGIALTVVSAIPSYKSEVENQFNKHAVEVRIGNEVDTLELYEGVNTERAQELVFKDTGKDNVITKECISRVIVCNSDSEEATLEKMYLDIKDVTPETKPNLYIIDRMQDGELCIEVQNIGWGDAPACKIELRCEDPSFQEFFGINMIVKHTDALPMQDKTCLPILSSADLKKQIMSNDTYFFTLDLKCLDDNGNDISAIADLTDIVVTKNGVSFAGGRGAASRQSYGFFFFADEEEKSFEMPVLETVGPKEMLNLPIIMSTDKSSHVRYRVGFDVRFLDGSEETIYSDFSSLEFEINSIDSAWRESNTAELSADELNGEVLRGHNPQIVSFPYSSLEEFAKQNESWLLRSTLN